MLCSIVGNLKIVSLPKFEFTYLDHGKCFQDAPDLSQLQPGPVVKAKHIQQEASFFQG